MLPQKLLIAIALAALSLAWCGYSTQAFADGKLVRRREYKGSLEEKAQEAIIVFKEGDGEHSAVEDLILKISVVGNAE